MANAKWPDRFVYVCGAGGAATVNVSPLLHSGRNCAVGVVIMSAVSNEENPTPTDYKESIYPTERLKGFCAKVLRLDPDTRIKVIPGHSDSFRPWAQVLHTAAEMARELDAEIVFNATGGRKPATIGALLGYRPTDPLAPKMTMISVGLSPFQARVIEIGSDGQIHETLLPIEDRLRIGTYLRQYGVSETAPEKRLVFEDFLLKSRAAAEMLAASAAMAGGRKSIVQLYNVLNREQKAAEVYWKFRPYSTSPPKVFLPAIAQVPGTRLNPGDTVSIETELAHGFLTGKWLEGLIFYKAREVFGGKNDVKIAAGLELGMPKKPKQRKPAITEFDLAILAEDRLDFVEAKAISGKMGKGKLHGAIDKLAKYRDQLSGPSGMAWLITPLLQTGELKDLDAFKHAENVGVKLLCGDAAVQKFGEELAESHRI